MLKYIRLLDNKNRGILIKETEKGYFRLGVRDNKLVEVDKFYFLPYTLRDTDLDGWYEEIQIDETNYIKEIQELHEKAIKLAEEKHKDQVDKNNEPYMNHIKRVASKCECLEDKIIATLHDIIEDTDETKESLLKVFPRFIVETVCELTRDKEKETYEDFIKRIGKNDLAIKIKLADLKDNYSRPMIEQYNSLKDRYEKAIKYLEG